MKYFSTIKEKFRISARPCDILYLCPQCFGLSGADVSPGKMSLEARSEERQLCLQDKTLQIFKSCSYNNNWLYRLSLICSMNKGPGKSSFN